MIKKKWNEEKERKEEEEFRRRLIEFGKNLTECCKKGKLSRNWRKVKNWKAMIMDSKKKGRKKIAEVKWERKKRENITNENRMYKKI